MGCAPSLLRRRTRQIGLREEVPDLPFSGNEVGTWYSHGNFVQHDISAFISPAPVAMLPPENPPPYSEELQEGHITLMRGTSACKGIEEDSNAMETSVLTGGDTTTWNTSLVTAGDVSIVSNSSMDPIASTDTAAYQEFDVAEEGQHRRGSCVSNIENTAFVDAAQSENNTHDDLTSMINTSGTTDPPEGSDHEEVESNQAESNDAARQPVAVPPSSIHFYRPLHRSLSVGNASHLMNEHLRVPNPRASSLQTMTLPEPVTTPFPPKVTLPPITRAPRNISPILREGWVPKEPFSRRPSRLPPLHRKRNRVSTWHGENNSIVSSVSAINTVQE